MCAAASLSVCFHRGWTGDASQGVCASTGGTFTLKMVSSSSCWGVCRVACFHGILKRIASRSIHTSPGYRPLSTCATSHGFRRTRRGVTDILPAEKQSALSKHFGYQPSLWHKNVFFFLNPTNPDFPNISPRQVNTLSCGRGYVRCSFASLLPLCVTQPGLRKMTIKAETSFNLE